MIRIEKSFFLFTALLFLLMLVACPTYTPIENDPIQKEPVTKADSLEYEFDYNYLLLEAYYFYANQELQSAEYYYYETSSPNVFDKIVNMYEEMEDPFTQYFEPEYFDWIYSWLVSSDESLGLGIEIDSSMIITQIYENSPADKNNMRVGDKIISVDSTETNTTSIFERLISGKLNETRVITALRDEDTLSFKLQIASILSPTVFLSWKDSIPIIKITEFSDSTANPKGTSAEFKKILEDTKTAKATVIDLRDNSGGAIDHCVDVAAEMLQKNDTLILEVSKYPDTNSYMQLTDTNIYKNAQDGIGKGRYYVFLQNEKTASCSEILIAAVTSNVNAPVVGTLSYGKGIGQYYFITYLSGIAAITSLEFLDKNFDSYNHYGIKPDFVIADSQDATHKALTLAKEQSYQRTEGYGNTYHLFTKKQANTSPQKDTHKGAFKLRKAPTLPLKTIE